MPILKEIKDVFDVFPQYPYADRSLVDRIRIAQNLKTKQYCVTTYPGGCGSAYEGFVTEFIGVKELFSSTHLNSVQISRDYGPSLFLSVKSAVPNDGGTELSGEIYSAPKDSSVITRVNPNFHLFEKLYAKIQELRPDLQKLLTQYVPESKNVMHFEYNFKDSSVKRDEKNQVDIMINHTTFIIRDESQKSFGVIIQHVEEIPFGLPNATKSYMKCFTLSPTVSNENMIIDLNLVELDKEKIIPFLALEEKIKRLYC